MLYIPLKRTRPRPLFEDTPWDEPTKHSSEYMAYKSGQIFNQQPWNRLGQDALCEKSFTLSSWTDWFLNVSLALICGLLIIDPDKRMTLPEAKQHRWCMRYIFVWNHSCCRF